MQDTRITGTPPPVSGIKQEIVRVKSESWKTFTIISSALFGTDIHWFGGRSHECTAESKKCNGCVRGWPRKWKGYIHAIDWQNEGKDCFVEVTPPAANMILMQAPDRRMLRGLIVKIAKTKGGPKGRYKIEMLQRIIPDNELPPEKDPRETLNFLWKCKNQYLNME